MTEQEIPALLDECREKMEEEKYKAFCQTVSQAANAYLRERRLKHLWMLIAVGWFLAAVSAWVCLLWR